MCASLLLSAPHTIPQPLPMVPAWEGTEAPSLAPHGLWPGGVKSRTLAPATAILQRHWQRKGSVEETMLELYHGDISVAKAEELARLIWGEAAAIAQVSESARRIAAEIREWCRRPLITPQVYVFCSTLRLRQPAACLQVALGINESGTREVLAVRSAPPEAVDAGGKLLEELGGRGLRGPRLFIGGNDLRMPAAVARHFPQACYQGSLDALAAGLRQAPLTVVVAIDRALAAMRAAKTKAEAVAAASGLAVHLTHEGQSEIAAEVVESAAFLFNYFECPRAHWARLQDVDPLRKTLSAFRERMRIVGPVSEEALVLLAVARLRHLADASWRRRRFFSG